MAVTRQILSPTDMRIYAYNRPHIYYRCVTNEIFFFFAVDVTQEKKYAVWQKKIAPLILYGICLFTRVAKLAIPVKLHAANIFPWMWRGKKIWKKSRPEKIAPVIAWHHYPCNSPMATAGISFDLATLLIVYARTIIGQVYNFFFFS